MDIGITEREFWDMTFAEVERAVISFNRVRERESKDKATFDYILADLIGRSVARAYHSSNKIPPISEVYPTLFNKEEEQQKIQDKKIELSALRFKQFAQSHNQKFKGGGAKQ